MELEENSSRQVRFSFFERLGYAREMKLSSLPGSKLVFRSLRLVGQTYFWLARDLFRGVDSGALRARADRAEYVVRAYYAYLLFLSFPLFSRAFRKWAEIEPATARLGLDVVAWIPLDNWSATGWICALIVLLGSLAGVAVPSSRLARFLTISSFLLLQALAHEARGKINHGLQAAVWVGILFLFLPSKKGKDDGELRNYLAGFFNAQSVVGLLYSCAGFCKILGIYFDLSEGLTWLQPDALPLTIAENWGNSAKTPLGGFLIAHPGLSNVLNVGVLYLEAGALFAVFRPHLHRVWGAGLILMHTSILLSMRIHFHESAIVLALMLLASPSPLQDCNHFTQQGDFLLLA